MSPPCLLNAWSAHESELRGYLRHRLGDVHDADELLQDVFLKALRQGRRFCAVENARAWFFQAARNALTDRMRCGREQLPLWPQAARPVAAEAPIDRLRRVPAAGNVLADLSEADRLALTLCDIEGQPQQVLADRLASLAPRRQVPSPAGPYPTAPAPGGGLQVRFDEAGTVCCFSLPPASALSPTDGRCILLWSYSSPCAVPHLSLLPRHHNPELRHDGRPKNSMTMALPCMATSVRRCRWGCVSARRPSMLWG